MKNIFYLIVVYIIILFCAGSGFAEALRATPTKAQEEITLTRDQILIVQAALNNAGHQCQRSGIIGKKTIRALRRFQAKQGLPVTGKIDIETLKVLGIY